MSKSSKRQPEVRDLIAVIRKETRAACKAVSCSHQKVKERADHQANCLVIDTVATRGNGIVGVFTRDTAELLAYLLNAYRVDPAWVDGPRTFKVVELTPEGKVTADYRGMVGCLNVIPEGVRV